MRRTRHSICIRDDKSRAGAGVTSSAGAARGGRSERCVRVLHAAGGYAVPVRAGFPLAPASTLTKVRGRDDEAQAGRSDLSLHGDGAGLVRGTCTGGPTRMPAKRRVPHAVRLFALPVASPRTPRGTPQSVFLPQGGIRLTAGWRCCRPTYHLIGNVTKSSDGSIKLEPINDASGVTYKDGIYHAWHQCCQNHWSAQCPPLRRRLRPGCSRTAPGRSFACTAPRRCDLPLTALCGLAGTMPFRRT